MHIRGDHAELDVPTLHEFVRSYPLGLFTTSIKSEQYPALQTSHIPFVLDSDAGEAGVLRGHMARANPQAKQLIELAKDSPLIEDEVLVLFNAPVHSYVTPKFYVETKPTTGKTVPTWDYAAVQVYGKLRVYAENNDETGMFLSQQISDLSDQQERAAGYIDNAWKVSDAPEKYTNLLKKAIIGLEIKIDRIEGRFKLSQEKGQGDWTGVVQGFRALGTPEGDTMAKMIEQAGKKKGLEI